MEFDNRHDEKRHWREERRRWREERHRLWHEGKRFGRDRGDDRDYSGNGGIWTGVLLLLIGTDYFLVENKVLPQWMWNWDMLLIALGFFVGFRHNFRGPAWFILIVIGTVFLVKSEEFTRYFPGINLNHVWPIALILLGVFLIFKPRRRYLGRIIDDKIPGTVEEKAAQPARPASSGEDFIDSTSIFGGVKKNILSKNFKGGDITNIMGGSEIDLSQADINGVATIDLTQIFGGTKLIVPANWQVKPQMAAIFGGVEDKRTIQNATLDPNKVLILDGTSIFGGIEIRSY